MWPLYAAGFTTAYSAHGIAANVEAYTKDRQGSPLILGALLARYDGTEVLLKPVSETLTDRTGLARPPIMASGRIH